MLFQHYWKQWCGDTQLLLQGLRESPASPQPNNPLIMVFERWFLEIKVQQPGLCFDGQFCCFPGRQTATAA